MSKGSRSVGVVSAAYVYVSTGCCNDVVASGVFVPLDIGEVLVSGFSCLLQSVASPVELLVFEHSTVVFPSLPFGDNSLV